MMNSYTVLSPHFKHQFESLRDLLQKTALLAEKCRDSESAGILKDRMGQLRSAALFVVVGEVKAGKSSFINALFGDDICPVDAARATSQ